MRRGARLKHLNRSGTFRSGNPRFYFRPKGQKGTPMPDLPIDHPGFLAAYVALAGEPIKSKPEPRTGTIGAALRAFRASDRFLSRATSTRGVWLRFLTEMEDTWGRSMLADLETRHIRKDLARFEPHPANNRRKVWRAFCSWCVDAGLIDDDPAEKVRPRATPRTEGHTPWTREDVAAFRKHWAPSTAQRLAFELMHRTCASIGDACVLGPGMIRDGWLTYTRKKSGSMASCPMGADAPAWFEHSEDLARAIAAQPQKHMTYMVTRAGRVRSHKAAAQWFSRACDDAGLPRLSAHGIRKHRASVFKENGASAEQRMAVLGHETEGEATRYSKSADLRRTIEGTESSNSSETGSNYRAETS